MESVTFAIDVKFEICRVANIKLPFSLIICKKNKRFIMFVNHGSTIKSLCLSVTIANGSGGDSSLSLINVCSGCRRFYSLQVFSLLMMY